MRAELELAGKADIKGQLAMSDKTDDVKWGFAFAGEQLRAGERKEFPVPIGRLYTHTELTISVSVIVGKVPGPVMLVSAAIHGDELNGIEICRELARQKSLARLAGVLIIVPVVNVFGMLNHSRYLPDRRDLNRCFPGSERGSIAARVAHIFLEKIAKQADYLIDLHTGAIHRSNLPQIRADLDDEETLAIANAFGTPIVLHSAIRDGSLRGVATDLGLKVLLYEAGEALRIDSVSVKVGVRGITSVMQFLDMLPKSKTRKLPKTLPTTAKSSYWQRAPGGGMFKSKAKLGERIEKGSTIGIVNDPTEVLSSVCEEIIAQHDGILIGINHLPLVNEGDALFHIARFDEIAEPEKRLEEYHSIVQNY